MLVGTNIKEFYKVTLDLGPLFNPYPSFQFQTSQSQETLLNQGLNIIPQYLMHGIQSNCGNNKHSSSEGTFFKNETQSTLNFVVI
jgi:hypothetical protein